MTHAPHNPSPRAPRPPAARGAAARSRPSGPRPDRVARAGIVALWSGLGVLVAMFLGAVAYDAARLERERSAAQAEIARRTPPPPPPPGPAETEQQRQERRGREIADWAARNLRGPAPAP